MAAVAVVVVSIAASTLDSTTSPNSGTGVGGTNESGDAVLPGVPENMSGSVGGVNPPRGLLFPIFVVGFVGALWYVWRYPGRSVGLFFLMLIVFAGFLVLAEFLLELFGETPGRGQDGLFGGGFGVSGGGVQAPEGSRIPLESLNVIAVLALGVVLVGVVLWLSEDPDDDLARERTGADRGTETGPIGRRAGEAADRIEADAAVDNEIYRAWVEMTDQLDVAHPDTSTPEEFASAAVDAGMRREDVEELTDVFREVRYGPEEPTAGHEGRAVEALRRIESTYAPGDE